MAWTAPRTWVVGEVVTKALLDEQLRDNLLAIDQHSHSGSAGDGGTSLGNLVKETFTDASAPGAPGNGLTVFYTVSGRLKYRAGAAGADTTLADENDLHAAQVQADQAAMEAETNEDTYVPPDLVRHSPGVAKAYCQVASDGSLQADSYNITSAAKDATGQYTITWDTDFTNNNYAVVVTADIGTPPGIFVAASAHATGTVSVDAANTAAASDVAFQLAAFGDQ